MSSAAILYDILPGKEGNLGIITLNRPKSLNALSHEMVITMHGKLIEWENDSDIKAVIVRAAEGRAFCAGGDLRLVHNNKGSNDPDLSHFFRDEYRLNHYIFHYTKPYISLLDGITMGGGAGISLNGSHCVATERLLFAMPETGVGFFPDVGGTYFLSRLPYGLGFYLGLTGARISCDDSLEMRLIPFKVHSASLPLIVQTIADTPLHNNPKDTVSHILHKFHLTPALSPLTEYYPFISKYFVKHSVEEILAALDAEPTAWHQETAAVLRQKSPTSLKVTLRQLHEGFKRDFDQCMQMEYHLMRHFIQGHDFYEGIRAILIDKTQDPRWQPSELHAITSENVDSYFMPMPGEKAQLLFS